MKYKVERISEEQEQRICELARGDEIELTVFLALRCGMRLSEILEFQAGDFDEMMGWVRVPCSAARDSLRHRFIMLTAEECSCLRECLERHPIAWRYTRRHLSYKVRRTLEQWGVEGVGLRELRHTAIIERIRLCMMGKAALAEVSEWAGYSDCATFYATYSRDIHELRRELWR